MKTKQNLFAALAMTLPLAGAMAQPTVTNCTTSAYATVTDPIRLAFAPDGTLYTGRDTSGSGGGAGDVVRINRIAPGGSPVTEFGNVPISDPDAVIVDVAGVVSGTPGAVLVGGHHTDTTTGKIVKIAPDGAVSLLFGPSASLRNPTDFLFDSSGRLWFTEYDHGKIFETSGGAPVARFDLGSAGFLAEDTAGRLVVSSWNDGVLRLYGTDGTLLNGNFATVNAGSPLARGLGGTWGTDIYAVAANGDLVRVDLQGNATNRVGTGFASFMDIEFGPDGALYASDFNGDRIWRIAPLVPPPPFTFTTNTVPVGDGDSGPDSLAAADVNGDGRLDLISANYGFRWGLPGDPGGWNDTLTVLTNNGSGGFASNVSLTIGRGPSAVVAADVNGDGNPDLISANETDNTLTVLTNAGNGGFAVHATLPVGSRPRGLVATDVNGDLAPDLVCVNAGGNSLTVLTNQGGGFGFHATLQVGNEPLFVAAADVNGDGKPDLISANKNDDSLTVLTNNTGGFGFSATLPVGHFPDAVAAADFDGDAKVDLVSVNWGAATMTVLTNNANGSFGFNATLPVGNFPSTVATADFNGDGAVDLICASSDDNSLRVLTNNGSGVFGYDTTVATGRIPNVFAADLNSDGRPDLACPNFRDGTVTVVLNTTLFAPAGSSRALTVRSQDGGVRVSWPSASPGWSLQQKRELAAPNWLPSGHEGFTITDDGINKSLTLPAASAGLFFRLLHP